jgi:hypothetical protein
MVEGFDHVMWRTWSFTHPPRQRGRALAIRSGAARAPEPFHVNDSLLVILRQGYTRSHLEPGR